MNSNGIFGSLRADGNTCIDSFLSVSNVFSSSSNSNYRIAGRPLKISNIFDEVTGSFYLPRLFISSIKTQYPSISSKTTYPVRP